MKYWAVIPAYNEAKTIREVVKSTLEQGCSVMVVDDGSTDGTADQLSGLPVEIVRSETNHGKGHAIFLGAQAVIKQGADAVITLDADKQHNPEHIKSLIECYQSHPGSLVVACRLQNRAIVPPMRSFANGFANFWISWAAGQRLQDTQSGFRLYPASVFTDIFIQHGAGRGFVFESEVLIEAARAGIDIRQVVIDAVYFDGQRPSHYRPLLDTMRITKMVAWKLLSKGMHINGLIRSLNLS